MSIVSLQQWREERSPHISGEAVCLACKHEWVAVAAVGTYQLDCPACSCSKGVFKNPCGQEWQWVCNCGCMIFYIAPNGVRCWTCGAPQVGY